MNTRETAMHGRVFRTNTLRIGALSSVSAAALMLGLSMPAAAQTAAGAQSAQAPAVEEIVVTGTRIVRDGYQAPTPLTVVGEEQLQNSATDNIADFVNKLPSVSGSISPQSSVTSISNGGAGIAALNLRNLGRERTLVLLDGQRSVGSNITGNVDVNDFPQGLISRVDVVTGGASAAYGSDALSGVVNFVLDKTFTGIKGEVSGGVTTYGDDRNWKVVLTGGTPFAGGRGHFLINGELSSRDGALDGARPWTQTGQNLMTNPNYTPTNGQPQILNLPNVGLNTATLGGVITNTALKGIAFGPGGTPYMFNYGSLVGSAYSQGGQWAANQFFAPITLDPAIYRQGLFTRASYDLTDNIEAFVQLSWGHTRGNYITAPQFNIGNISVSASNPFLPAAVAAQAQAAGVTSFVLGTMNGDLPYFGADNDRTTNRYVVGADGKFDAMDTTWTWNAYYQKGVTRTTERATNDSVKANFSSAINAVKGPNGTIVCASTLTNPTNGCVPYNLFGTGVNSQAVINYLEPAPAMRHQDFHQDVISAQINGEPFSDWAGPVSIATGIEHRRESVRGDADPNSLINGLFVGNYLPTFGHYDVTEGFVETVVPLAKDVAWAKELDLNAAVRATGYSVSGYVTTWKVGGTWDIIPDIRIRATRSRDIRAPNLNDLFAAGTANTNTVIDPFNGNQSVQYQGLVVGNTKLTPEKADTTGLGVVLQPSFFPGFSASVDYWVIDIGDAIATLPAQSIVNFCFNGQTQYCPSVIRGIGIGGTTVITQIRIQPFNEAIQRARGLDFEASYTTHLSDIVNSWNGSLSLRVLATHYLENYNNNFINPAYDTVGENSGDGPPNWSYNATLTYSNDPITFSLTGRGISAGVYSNNFYRYIQCTSGCPASTPTATTINDASLAGAFYLDTAFSYKIADTGSEAFLNIQNLTNKDPALVGKGPAGTGSIFTAANPVLYDVLGRVFRVGIRFKM